MVKLGDCREFPFHTCKEITVVVNSVNQFVLRLQKPLIRVIIQQQFNIINIIKT
jgi:hypothetical protein